MSDSSRKSHGIGAAVDKLFRGIEILIAIFLGAMIFFTFMNVILRQFGIGFPWSEEIARICFIYLIYLGAIIAARENQHLMIDTLICKLPPLGQKVLYVIIQGLIIWLMWILTNGAFLNAWNNRNDFWVATHFPVFLVHFAGVLLGATGLWGAMSGHFIGSAIAAVGDFLSGPTACAILFVVGYNIEFSRGSLVGAVRAAGVRLLFCAAFCVLCVLFLTWTVGMTDLLRWALILLFTLPGPYVLPVFARGEADARYASSCLSLYTLLSVAMFCVIAVLAV